MLTRLVVRCSVLVSASSGEGGILLSAVAAPQIHGAGNEATIALTPSSHCLHSSTVLTCS